MAYYVIEHLDRNGRKYITVETEPGRENHSGKIRFHGWLGSTNNHSQTAHGRYDTYDEASNYISDRWPSWEEFTPDTWEEAPPSDDQ